MLLFCLAPQEHAGQAKRSDAAPKVAILVPRLHMTRSTSLETPLKSLSSAELPELPRLAILDGIDELTKDQVWTPGLKQAMLCRYPIR